MQTVRGLSASDRHQRLTELLRGLHDRGFGGIVTNLPPDGYLEDEEAWIALRETLNVCRETGLCVWLYDEIGYPSGSANGLVLREDPSLEAKALMRTEAGADAGDVLVPAPRPWSSVVRAEAHLGDRVIDITGSVGPDGILRWQCPDRCRIVRFDVRPAFEGTHAAHNVHAVRRYIDVLDAKAVNAFWHITYQRYIDRLADDIEIVDAIFTDEPSMMGPYFPDIGTVFPWGNVKVTDQPDPDADRFPQVPWTHALPEVYAERTGRSLPEELDLVFGADGSSGPRVRHDFNEMLTDLFTRTFFGTLQDRLADGPLLTGHMLHEESIVAAVANGGSVMAGLGRMRLPGSDMLTSLPEQIVTTPHVLPCKYASSAAHLRASREVMCESSDVLQMVEDRPTTVVQRRGALCVEAALGITTFTSYYRWDHLDGDEVAQLLAMCGRLSSFLQAGVHVADAAVLYPARTIWTHLRPVAQTMNGSTQPEPLGSIDGTITGTAILLFRAGADFDFVSHESLLEAGGGSDGLTLGEESYPWLVIPPHTVIEPAEAEAIEHVISAGARLVVLEPADPATLGLDVSEWAARLGNHVVIDELGGEWPDQVARSRPAIVRAAGGDPPPIIRRSRLDHGPEAVLVANPSPEPVRIERDASTAALIWDPWTGESRPWGRSTVRVPGHGALVVVPEDTETMS